MLDSGHHSNCFGAQRRASDRERITLGNLFFLPTCECTRTTLLLSVQVYNVSQSKLEAILISSFAVSYPPPMLTPNPNL